MVTSEVEGTIQLPSGADGRWCVRARKPIPPELEAALEPDLERQLILPEGIELPELVYIAGGGYSPVRMLYPTSERHGGRILWAENIGDRDLAMLETLAQVILARVREVRRDREPGQ
jgi:hypothetical protein